MQLITLMTALLSVNQNRNLTELIYKVLTHIQDFGFQFWSEKYNFYLHTIKYLGFIFDCYGRCLDPANVAAIQRIPHTSSHGVGAVVSHIFADKSEKLSYMQPDLWRPLNATTAK